VVVRVQRLAHFYGPVVVSSCSWLCRHWICPQPGLTHPQALPALPKVFGGSWPIYLSLLNPQHGGGKATAGTTPHSHNADPTATDLVAQYKKLGQARPEPVGHRAARIRGEPGA
jgi:hypothetical protein